MWAADTARTEMTPTTPDPYSRASAPDPHSSTPVPDPHSPALATDTTLEATPGFQHWGRVYAFVLAFLALLIALFAWLTRIYS